MIKLNGKIAKKNNSKVNFKSAKPVKKVGIFAGVTFIISSVIGVGIFLKNGQIMSFNLGNFTLTLLSWILTSVSVLALALSLMIIAYKSDSDLGILQWAKNFLSPSLYETIKFYFIFLYVPLIVCGDSFYFLQTLQQAFSSWHTYWFYAWIITFCVIAYFVVVNNLKPRMVLIHANIAFVVKLIPIVFFAIVAFILYFINYDDIRGTTQQLYSLNQSGFLQELKFKGNINSIYYKNPMLLYGPEIGFFLSIPAIFFAFDGFYYVVGIRNQLKNPKHSPTIIVIGVLSIAIISILITLSLLISTNVHESTRGSMVGVPYLEGKWKTLGSILNLCVCIGCLGIISSSLNFSATLYRELIRNNDLPFSLWIRKKTNWSSMKIAYIYLYIYLFIFFLLISFVGTFGFLNLYDYDFGYTKDAKVNQLYSFIDVVTNWESLFTFSTFVVIIIGSWVAMRYKKLTFRSPFKTSLYLFESIFACLTIILAFSFAIYHAIGNLIYVIEHDYFYNKSSDFYNLNNLNGTEIIVDGNTYKCIYSSTYNSIEWLNIVNNEPLKTKEFTISKIILNNSNFNPYLFYLVATNNDWINIYHLSGFSDKTLLSQINNVANLKKLTLGETNSVYETFFQTYIAEIINFIILAIMILSCFLYTIINRITRKNGKTWFKIYPNIFHDEDLEIHF